LRRRGLEIVLGENGSGMVKTPFSTWDRARIRADPNTFPPEVRERRERTNNVRSIVALRFFPDAVPDRAKNIFTRCGTSHGEAFTYWIFRKCIIVLLLKGSAG
jgi:hypothetical protein